jgi:cytosine/adenosine deaminase-related metal-dependent hydrolase
MSQSSPRLIVEASWAAVPDGPLRPSTAILIEDGRIQAVESRETLATAGGRRIGGNGLLALPGLVNAHQHGQPDAKPALAVQDAPLECWLVSLLAASATDPYLETRRLGSQLARSGVATTAHVHYRQAATADGYEAELRAILAAYRDSGVRAVVACDIRDRGQPVSGDVGAFLAGLPPALRDRARALISPGPATEAMLDIAMALRAAARTGALGDVDLAFGPPGPPWCSDELLVAVARVSAADDAGVHTHLLETWYEREFGLREYPGGTVAALGEFGLLTPRLLAAHGVWLDDVDCAALAETGVSVVTNPSSNLRLHAGAAPLRPLLAAGVNVAVGTDNLALSPEDDVLGELRLLRGLHRRPGIDEQGLDARSCLRLGTENGGKALCRPDVGMLRPGAVGDVVLVDVGRLTRSRLADPLEVALACAGTDDIVAVIAGGRVHARDLVSAPPATDCSPELRETVTALMPYVRAHYRSWHRPQEADGVPRPRAL